MRFWLRLFIEVLSMSKDIEGSRIFPRRVTEFRKDAAEFGGELAELRKWKQSCTRVTIFVWNRASTLFLHHGCTYLDDSYQYLLNRFQCYDLVLLFLFIEF